MGKALLRLLLRYGGDQLADAGAFLMLACTIRGIPENTTQATALLKLALRYVLEHGSPTRAAVEEYLKPVA